MSYTFKFWQELGWACLVAAMVQIATIMVGFNPEAITDWRAWAVALAGAVTRAVFGAILAAFTNPIKD